MLIEAAELMPLVSFWFYNWNPPTGAGMVFFLCLPKTETRSDARSSTPM